MAKVATPKLIAVPVTAGGARKLKHRVPESDLDVRFYWPDSDKGYVITDEDGDTFALFPHVLGGAVIFHDDGMDFAPIHTADADERRALFYDRHHCTVDMALNTFRCWRGETCVNGNGEEWSWLDYPRQIATREERREREKEEVDA